jgi:Flp pilus assembly protein TadB
MKEDELENQALFHKMQKRQELFEEFEKLRPNWRGSAVRFAGTILCVAFLIWMYPEITQHPVLYILLILILGVGAELRAESKRTNKRIDALHKMFKDGI